MVEGIDTGKSIHFGTSQVIILTAKKFASDLRKKQTQCENVLWEGLRGRRVLGLKFLRQHPLFLRIDGGEYFFIPDFYCHEKSLALEIDGPIHKRRSNHDNFRTELLNNVGVTVYRIRNEDVETNLTQVMSDLKKYLMTP